MRVLLEVCKAAESAGGTLVLVAPQPIVARMLRLCGADQLIVVYSNVSEVPPHQLLPMEEMIAAVPSIDQNYTFWVSGSG